MSPDPVLCYTIRAWVFAVCRFVFLAVGWVAVTTWALAILAVIFLTLMFTENRSFGKVNDVFNSMIGISSIVLAWTLYAELHAKSPSMSQIALALAVVGAVFTIIGSILIIYGFTDFVLAGWFTGLGTALIGLWLVAFCCSILHGMRYFHVFRGPWHDFPASKHNSSPLLRM